MPIQPLNVTGAINGAINSLARVPPSSSGDGSRQNKIPSNRAASHTRNLIRWFVPETGIIDMYINPENITTSYSKAIANQRTKGGYVLQYWGEDLITLSLSGTTGSSGVEGINVLEDIYRSEQVSFDPYALAFAAALDRNQGSETVLGDAEPGGILGLIGAGISNDFVSQVTNSLESGTTNPTRPRPTLASLAFSVEMYWSGWTYRGYFKDFKVTESAQKLGLFDYTATFIATQKRGYRANFLGWHRSPTSGPSNSDPIMGVPYSYGGLFPAQQVQSGRQIQEKTISQNNRLISSTGYIGDMGSNTRNI
jgi:hypothetical protein